MDLKKHYLSFKSPQHMKQSFLVVALLFCAVTFSQGQTKPPARPAGSSNCFAEWYTLFKERGATAVPDGVQDVIITLRNNDYTECFMGRIEVANSKLAGKLQIQKVDGSFEEFDKRVSTSFMNSDGTLKEDLRDITNGMSSSVTLSDGDYIRLFFY